MRLKKSFLVRFEILGLLINTLAIDDEYSRQNKKKLPLPIQIQLSKIQSNFAAFLLHFQNVYFEHFEKQKKLIALTSEIIDSERRGYRNA